MAITRNPTKTRTIENNWVREANRRWRRFEQAVKLELERFDRDMGLNFVVNVFEMNPSQLAEFMRIVNDLLDREILAVIRREGPNVVDFDDWQAKYIDQSYFRSLESAARELSSQIPAGTPVPADLAALAAATPGAADDLARVIGQTAIHLESRAFLHGRAFESLKDVAADDARRIRNVLQTAIDEGQGIREITRNLSEQVAISRRRSHLIARTETIQAYQRSHINQAQVVEDQIGEQILLRWVTVLDSRVRHSHAANHGRLFTPEEARIAINRSPWNCRCGLLEVIQEANTPEKDEKFTKERERLQEMEAQDG